MFLPAIEPLHLCPVAAASHVTPAAMMVLARIQEKPLASFGVACANIRQLVRRQQIAGGAGNGPQHAIKFAQIVEAPLEAALQRGQMHVRSGALNVGVEPSERGGRHRALVDDSPENVVDCLAQFSCPEQSLLRTLGIEATALAKPVHLSRFKQPRVFGESRKIRIGLQQFFGLGVAVVESVDEVEANVSRNQIEAGRTAPHDFSRFPGLGQSVSFPMSII